MKSVNYSVTCDIMLTTVTVSSWSKIATNYYLNETNNLHANLVGKSTLKEKMGHEWKELYYSYPG